MDHEGQAAAATNASSAGARPVLSAASSGIELLEQHALIRLVLDRLDQPGDILCAAMACSSFRDALWARLPRAIPSRGCVSPLMVRQAIGVVDHMATSPARCDCPPHPRSPG